MEFHPLRLVMRVFELARVRALARRFQFDETDERVVNRDRVVRSRFQIAERRLADRSHFCSGDVGKLREIGEQGFKWRAKLILRLAGRGEVRELLPGGGSKRGNGRTDS